MGASPASAASTAVRLALVGLAGLAVLLVLNDFAGHLTPDASIYLLNARTFVETGDRFSLSHDSKGLLLTVGLAGPVWLLGGTMAAAALAQLVAFAVAGLAAYAVARGFTSRAAAATLALLIACAAHSHLLWGANGRPEDLALGYAGVALLAAWRGTPRWLIAGGAMAACCALTKTTLVLAPAALLVAGAVPARHADRTAAAMAGRLGWIALGGVLVAAPVVGWVAVFDSWTGMIWQCVEWPALYRRMFPPAPQLAQRLMAQLAHGGLTLVALAAVVGFVRGWRAGHRRLVVLLAVFAVAELARVALEGAQWRYTIELLVLPFVLGSGLATASRDGPAAPWKVVAVPLGCTAYLLGATLYAEAQAFEYRIAHPKPAPTELLAAGMRARGYHRDQTVFVEGGDPQLYLLLPAPRPYPVRALDFKRMPKPVREAAQRFHADHPPDWVVTRPPDTDTADAPPPGIVGATNHAFHVVVDASRAMRVPPARERTGAELFPMLPPAARYRLAFEVASMAVWRRID